MMRVICEQPAARRQPLVQPERRQAIVENTSCLVAGDLPIPKGPGIDATL